MARITLTGKETSVQSIHPLAMFLAGMLALPVPAMAQAAALAQSQTPAVVAVAPPTEDAAQLAAAWDEFSATLAGLTQFLREHPYYGEAENRPAAYSYLIGLMIARLEEDVIFDPDYPYFRVLDHRIREGGDNPDQRYLMAAINGGETYRIWGRRGKERRLDFQVYAGDPFVPNGGRMASFLGSDALKVADDGTFEVWVSPQRHEGNWLENPADGNQMLVRQIFSDWNREVPGDLHIDRYGHEGDLKPPVGARDMAGRLRKAASGLERHVRVWPAMVARRYLDLPANTLSEPSDPAALGGVPGRFMVAGNFDLGEDEALIVRAWPMSGNYQGIQLADPWFSSLEYANRQTSLSGEQSSLGADGAYTYVLSRRDPGVPNWLDTAGRRRGAILMRFDGIKEKTFDKARYPTALKVKLADLGKYLPEEVPTVTLQQRAEEIARRRRHIQLRYDN